MIKTILSLLAYLNTSILVNAILSLTLALFTLDCMNIICYYILIKPLYSMITAIKWTIPRMMLLA